MRQQFEAFHFWLEKARFFASEAGIVSFSNGVCIGYPDRFASSKGN
jgi:hypothetical protein